MGHRFVVYENFNSSYSPFTIQLIPAALLATPLYLPTYPFSQPFHPLTPSLRSFHPSIQQNPPTNPISKLSKQSNPPLPHLPHCPRCCYWRKSHWLARLARLSPLGLFSLCVYLCWKVCHFLCVLFFLLSFPFFFYSAVPDC